MIGVKDFEIIAPVICQEKNAARKACKKYKQNYQLLAFVADNGRYYSCYFLFDETKRYKDVMQVVQEITENEFLDMLNQSKNK